MIATYGRMALATVVVVVGACGHEAAELRTADQAKLHEKAQVARSRLLALSTRELAAKCYAVFDLFEGSLDGIDEATLVAMMDVCEDRDDLIRAYKDEKRLVEIEACATALPLMRCEELFGALDCTQDLQTCAVDRGLLIVSDGD